MSTHSFRSLLMEQLSRCSARSPLSRPRLLCPVVPQIILFLSFVSICRIFPFSMTQCIECFVRVIIWGALTVRCPACLSVHHELFSLLLTAVGFMLFFSFISSWWVSGTVLSLCHLMYCDALLCCDTLARYALVTNFLWRRCVLWGMDHILIYLCSRSLFEYSIT